MRPPASPTPIQLAAVLRSTQLRSRVAAVVEVTLHLPPPHIELPPRTAVDTGSVRLTVQRERPAQLLMPATEQFGEPACNGGMAGHGNRNLHDVLMMSYD